MVDNTQLYQMILAPPGHGRLRPEAYRMHAQMTLFPPRLMACLALLTAVSVCAACTAEAPPAQQSAAPAPAPAAQAASTNPMVMFMAPQDGSTSSSPVHIMFGAEHFEIAAVPQGTVETTRPGMGHYHVAVDSECLPTGETIPKAAPWTHFGDGKNMIDMQLPPGKHTLTVQIGDDLHRTIEGLCKTITVTVQ